jgi:hypothetical protein
MEVLWKKLIAKAWADPDWKQSLVTDPVTVLKVEGIALPEGAKIRVVEELPGTRTFVLPLAPDGTWNVEAAEQRRNAPCATNCGGAGT